MLTNKDNVECWKNEQQTVKYKENYKQSLCLNFKSKVVVHMVCMHIKLL